MGDLLLGSPPSWTQAIVLDAFVPPAKMKAAETSFSLPGVRRRQRVAADRDRIRRSFIKNGYRLIVQRERQARASVHVQRPRLKRSVSAHPRPR